MRTLVLAKCHHSGLLEQECRASNRHYEELVNRESELLIVTVYRLLLMFPVVTRLLQLLDLNAAIVFNLAQQRCILATEGHDDGYPVDDDQGVH